MNKYDEMLGDDYTRSRRAAAAVPDDATGGPATATATAGSGSSSGFGGTGGGFGGRGGSFGAGDGTGGGLPVGEYGGGTGVFSGGGYAGGGSLVVEAQETSTGLSGLRLVEDGQDVVDALKTDSWVDDALAGFGTAADAVALVTDPIGEALGTVIGWAIEHLDPLKTWLYELTGHPGQVAAGAGTWANIAAKLDTCSTDLTDSIRVRLGGQSSEAVRAYKSFQLDNAVRLSLVASLAEAVSKGLTVASVIVQVVHDMVRDAIADVLAKLSIKLAATVATAGLAAIWAAPSLMKDVSKWAARLRREVTAVVKSASSLGKLFKRANTLMDNLSDGLKSLGPRPALATAGTTPRAPRSPWASRASSTPSRPKGGGTGTGSSGGRPRGGKGADCPYVPRDGNHYPGVRKPTRGASDGGPGEWGPGKNHSKSNRSQAYEEQVTGVTIEDSYYVDGVEFDGFYDGILHDAKGSYYNLTQTPFGNKVINELVKSARRQVGAVRAVGANTPIRWHVAEPEMLDLLKDLQSKGRFPAGIELVHTPPDF
ncbi:Tox-REase-5 domain-containing protein [Actinomyces qiguomingii]|uniref:Tox-REase-5 domain-containing protein n=1 Tax=Actinomyces qiguomingii TaxID=2057800 RepID=UPI000FFE6199|nr:Tox-REase-5 domain-containing protein [Actinomyces qiguomingii]